MTSVIIIYIDESLIVIDKPAGLPSTSIMVSEKDTLAAHMLKQFPDQANIQRGQLEAGLVHRLDTQTSGVIVAARTNAAYDNLRSQFDAGSVEKKYAALVLGTAPPKGLIDYPIAHHPRKKNKMIVCKTYSDTARLKAREAKTLFRADKIFDHDGTKYTLLSVEIKTGVRHQIRAHLASMGHPIVGDALYQNAKMRRADSLGLTRHFLHAVKISFDHPATGEGVSFVSPVPKELEEALENLAEMKT